MSTTTRRLVEPQVEPEQQPWRAPDDRRGWNVVAVGARHPGALLRDIEARLQHYRLLGVADAAAYRRAARAIVEPLLGKVTEATSTDEVQVIVRAALQKTGHQVSVTDDPTFAALMNDIDASWRRYTAG